MDEAERCHRLAFIFRGELLATGTPTEIVQARKLGITELHVEPDRTLQAAEALRRAPGIEEVNHFGLVMRIASRGVDDPDDLVRVTLDAAGIAIVSIERGRPDVEDAFVSMVHEDSVAASKEAAA
jgi:ABC-2 type transport system ATP-binding protein